MVSISSLCTRPQGWWTRAKRWVHPKWVEMKRLPRLEVELTAPPNEYAKNPQTGWGFQPIRVHGYCLREVGETGGSLLWGAVKKKVFKVHQFQGTTGKGTPLNVRNEVRLASRVSHLSRPTWNLEAWRWARMLKTDSCCASRAKSEGSNPG